MAYNTRFTCNFADLYGMNYKLEIKEDGYSGLSSNILLGAGGFRLTYSGNNRGVGSLIMGSKVDFELQVTNATEKEFIKDLALAGDRDFICTISRDEGAGLYQFWTGFIMSDLVTFQDAPFPFSFNVVASDGFGLAKEIDYTNSVWDAAGKPSDVYRTHAQLLVECFNLIGLSDELTASYPFMIGDTLVKEANQIDLSNQSKLDVTRLNTKAFALYDTSNEDVAYTYKSVYEVLNEICKTWNARLIQYDGKFWFIPVANYLDTSANFFPMGINGIFDNNPLNISLYQTANKYRRLVGGNFDFYPPLAKSCIEYGYYFDPLSEDNVEKTTCGGSEAATILNLEEGIPLEGFNGYNGDASTDISLGFRYNLIWHHNLTQTLLTPPNNYRLVMKYRVLSGDYRLVNKIDTDYTPTTDLTFTDAEWFKNAEQTFTELSNGQSSLDISDMECFGFPESEAYIKLIVDGEIISKSKYVYDNVAKTITFSDIGGSVTIEEDSVVTVVFDYDTNGFIYVDVTDSFDIETPTNLNWVGANTTKSTINPVVISVENIPDNSLSIQSGDTTLYASATDPFFNLDFLLIPRSDESAAYLQVDRLFYHPFPNSSIAGAVGGVLVNAGGISSRHFRVNELEASGKYSAQPTSSSKTVKECLENTNDSAENLTIQMFTGDRSEVGSDSNIEIQKTNGDWVKSSEWTISASGLSFTGRLSNCINKTNLHIQETPSLRYNGSVTRVGVDLFDVIKGIKIPTFNETDDNLFFGGGSFIASEAIWNIQMIQLGIDN